MESFLRIFINALKKVWTSFTILKSLEREMKILIEKSDELNALVQSVISDLKIYEHQQDKKQKREAVVWLDSVKRLKNKVHNIEKEVREEKGLISRYRLIQHIADVKDEAVELKEKSECLDLVAIKQSMGIPRPQPVATLIGESANITMERIWNHLLDVEIRKVGVYGMGGVGKTTILKHIHNQLLCLGVFKSIIWVNVSEALDLHRLQQEIASAIGLDLLDTCDNEESRSLRVHAELSQREKCLLILDDVWIPFALDRVGIPEPDQTNRFKLVVTTRSMMVCRGLESERIVKVGVLLDVEAWDLFKEKVGERVLDSSEIKSIAKLIVQECGCLPLAIITAGRALREVGKVCVWRNALHELRHSNTKIVGMGDSLFPHLMFSYHRLRNDRIRNCFLYCALYPEDYEIGIDQLIDNWVGEGLIDELGNMEKERDKGYTILSELNDACMVEFIHEKLAGNPKKVKLHRLLQDVAIAFTRESSQFIVKAREQLEEPPSVEEWAEDTRRVSLMDNKMKVLSGQSPCPRLTTLLLQENECLVELSSSFFDYIQGIRVLDLSETGIMSLPESFSALKFLRVLRLDSCQQLHRVPCLGKMHQLRVLSLDDTLMEELPQGIEELANLRKLSLNRTRRLKVFPAGIIPKLYHLEELQMINSGWRWPSKTARAAADIKEIANMTGIAHLQLSFEDVQSFNKFVESGKLLTMERFCITLGEGFPTWAKCCLKNAVVGSGVAVGSYANSIMLPCNIQGVEIKEVRYITSLLQFSCLANETRLDLEVLGLYRMPNLRALSDGVASIDSFANLERLYITGCNQLKSLFSLVLLHKLQNLEIIDTQECALLEDIVAVDGNALTTFSFPKLKYLGLEHLPKLKSVFKTSVTCSSLEYLRIIDCPNLKKLPFTSHNLPPTLQGLCGGKEWWDALEWVDPYIKIQLQGHFIDE